MKNILQSLKVVALSLILSFGVSFIYAWTGPTTTPPAGNANAPINTSTNGQYKGGPLGVEGLFSGYSGASFEGAVVMKNGSQLQLNNSTDTAVGFLQGVGNQIQFQTSGGSPRMTIDTSSGNVGIGTNAPAAKLEVVGEIKSSGDITLGNTGSTCSNTNKGSIRYNSTSNKLQYCNGTSYKTVSDTIVYLVNSLHNEDQCTSLSGVVVSDGAGNEICKFTASSCPVGWAQYYNWSTTQSQSTGYVNEGCATSICDYSDAVCHLNMCTTNSATCYSGGSHIWSNTPVESNSCSGRQMYTGRVSDNRYADWGCSTSPYSISLNYCLGATNVTATSITTAIGCY